MAFSSEVGLRAGDLAQLTEYMKLWGLALGLQILGVVVCVYNLNTLAMEAEGSVHGYLLLHWEF